MPFDRVKSSERITEMLAEKGIKQKELAYALRINHANTISYWTSKGDNYRQPTIEQFANLADFFGVSVDYLMGLTPDKRRCSSLVDELGLSTEAVDRLLSIARNPQGRNILNTILESEEFAALIHKISLVLDIEGGM